MTQAICTDFDFHETEFKTTAFEEAIEAFWEPFLNFFDNCNKEKFIIMAGIG